MYRRSRTIPWKRLRTPVAYVCAQCRRGFGGRQLRMEPGTARLSRRSGHAVLSRSRKPALRQFFIESARDAPMRDLLAEQLLAKVMGWQPADVAAERAVLRALADHKYDD